jgi:hypothetical protein
VGACGPPGRIWAASYVRGSSLLSPHVLEIREVAVKNTSRVIRHGQVARGFSLCLVAVALTLGVLPAQAASATTPPSGTLTVKLVCASRATSGHYRSVSVSGKVFHLRPNTPFGITVHQPPSLQGPTAQDPVRTSNASGVLSLTAVIIKAATDHNQPYTKGPASFNALYTGLIGVQGGGPGLVADLNVTIPGICI